MAPKYGLTARQEEAWVQFIREAKKEIKEEGREPKKIYPTQKHKKRRSRDDAESEEEDQGQGHPEEAEQEELTAT